MLVGDPAVAANNPATRDRDRGDTHHDERQARPERADFDPLPSDLSAWPVRKEQEDKRAKGDDSHPDNNKDRHGASLRPTPRAVNWPSSAFAAGPMIGAGSDGVRSGARRDAKLREMRELRREVEIDAPPERVWRS
jgi:hypothetical protein